MNKNTKQRTPNGIEKPYWDNKKYAWISEETIFDIPRKTWFKRICIRLAMCRSILFGKTSYAIYEKCQDDFFKSGRVLKRQLIYYMKKK